MNKYSLIIFDMDGTTIDTYLAIALAWIELFKKHKKEYRPSLEDLVAFSGPVLVDSLKKEFPGQDIEPLRKDFIEIADRIYLEGWAVPYPMVEETLSILRDRGIKIGINTNKSNANAKLCLEQAGLTSLVDCMISGGDVSTIKPDPLGVYTIMERLGVSDKKKVLYVGDGIYDQETARRAGVDFAFASYGPKIPHIEDNYPPVFSFSSFKDFIKELDEHD